MEVTVTKAEKRKSFLITLVIYALFVLLLFFIRFWPPSNPTEMLLAGGGGGGVTVNFGDTDFGSGDNFKSEVVDIKEDEKQAVETKPVTEESILSQETTEEETVLVPKNIKKEQPKKEEIKAPKKEVEKPKVTKSTNDVLSNLLKGNTKGGDGNSSTKGNQGKANGSLSSEGYGNGGSGGGTGGGNGTGEGTGSGSGIGSGSGAGTGGGNGYSLGNRKAISKPSPKYNCDEYGKVVVEVTVDRLGNTISVVAGVKGTTNTAKCLLDQAKIAAMNTKWQSSNDAPESQVGKIVYSFSLN